MPDAIVNVVNEQVVVTVSGSELLQPALTAAAASAAAAAASVASIPGVMQPYVDSAAASVASIPGVMQPYVDSATAAQTAAGVQAGYAASSATALDTAFRKTGVLGRPVGSNPITANSFAVSRFVLNERATEDRTIETIDIFIASGAPKTIILKRAQLTKAEFGFSGVGDVTVTIPANGYNAGLVVPGGFTWVKGEFVGLETTSTGGLLRSTATADGNGYYTATGTPATIARGNPVTANRLEIRLNWKAQIVSADKYTTTNARIDVHDTAILAQTRRSIRRREYTGSASILPILVGRNGGIMLGWDSSKQILVGPGIGSSSSSSSDSSSYMLLTNPPIVATWNGLIADGESLSVGTSASPPLSTSPIYNALTFGSGVKSGKAGSSTGAVQNSPGVSTTRALYEDGLGVMGETGAGETVLSRAAKVAIEMAAEKKGIAPTQHIIFASTAGRGSQQIGNIKKGGSWYQQLIDQVTAAKALAPGGSFAVHAMPLIIGQNNSANSTRIYFSTELIQFALDINTDIKAITGQTSPVYILAYQTPTTITSGANIPANQGAVTLAWYDAINASPYIKFATPYYFLRFGDGVHPNNYSNAWAGAYFGRAYYQLVHEKRVPDCVWPISAVARDTTLRVKFRVPAKPLVIDAITIGQATNNGFRVLDDTGDLTLGNMYIENSDTLVIPLNRALGTNPKLRSAMDYQGAGLSAGAGASTNLRDSTTDSTVIDGITRALPHWCPHFDMAISALEVTN